MLSRRSFLGLAGGAVLLAACGGNDDTGTGPGATLAHDHDDDLTELSPAVMSSDLHVSGTPQRFAFAMLAREGYASIGPATLAVAPGDARPVDFGPTTLHTEGLPARRGVYVTELVLDRAGIWNAVAMYEGEELPFAFQVHERATAPEIGAPAPRAASPTPGAPLGVDPICTRDPQCDLHAQSLDTLVGAGRPVAVLFATPARCASQYCGPVLDSLLPLVSEFDDRVTVVHVDIFESLTSENLVPTVADWGLPSEPWFFGIDAAGTVTARIDGAFGQNEMRAILEDLASG